MKSTKYAFDSSLEPGFLTYGEYFLPGETIGRSTDLVSCLPSVTRQ